MVKSDRIIYTAAAGIFLTAAFIIISLFLIPEPPSEAIEQARLAIAGSRKSGAEIYSPHLYRESAASYDSAMLHWQNENKRFIFFRDYEPSRQFAEKALQKANEAASAAKASSLSLEKEVETKIIKLNQVAFKIDSLFRAFPLTPEIRDRISKGRMLLKESELDFDNNQLLPASRKVTQAEFMLNSSFEFAGTSLRSYFENHPKWKEWVESTIRNSREKKEYAIIIDKYARKCLVYQAGKMKYEFRAELGLNWVGDKLYSGDKATPEGLYKVARKIENGKTKYYKALLLDYPLQDDKQRFEELKSKGELPYNARIGGLIEIHGNGGKGADWTDGCVALTDRDMDIVYKLARVGTPVTIVGSVEMIGDF